MTRRSLILALALGAGLADRAMAAPYNTKFCVSVMVTFTDSSNGGTDPVPDTPDTSWWLLAGASPERIEDNWPEQTAARPPRGARYELKYGTTVLMSGYLDDGFGAQGAGCTANYTGSLAPQTLTIYSRGSIQSNWLYAYDPTQAVDAMTASTAGAPQSGPMYLTYQPSGTTESRVWTGFIGGSYALYRHAGGETNNYFQFYLCQCTGTPPSCDEVGNPPSGCVCSPDQAGTSCTASNNTNNSMNAGNGSHLTSVFTNSGIRRKFTLIHEMGHIMANKVTEGVANGGDCSGNDVEPCYESGTGSHAFWSREGSRCAFKEAFADFYAADVWNDHNEDNCAFKYYKTNASTTDLGEFIGGAAFDCAGDDGSDPGTTPDDFTNYQGDTQVGYLTQCNEVNYLMHHYYGLGTELDWLRVLWNLHTDGASPPSYTTIVRWIRDCVTQLDDALAFSQLDACADFQGGTLNTNWDAGKSVHAIDYVPW